MSFGRHFTCCYLCFCFSSCCCQRQWLIVWPCVSHMRTSHIHIHPPLHTINGLQKVTKLSVGFKSARHINQSESSSNSSSVSGNSNGNGNGDKLLATHLSCGHWKWLCHQAFSVLCGVKFHLCCRTHNGMRPEEAAEPARLQHMRLQISQ